MVRLSLCFLASAAALDTTAPVIKLDLDESALVHRKTCSKESGCKLAKSHWSRHQSGALKNIQESQLSSYVHSCVAKKATKATCPLPAAKAYDHHDGLLAKVNYKLYLVNDDGVPNANPRAFCSSDSNKNDCFPNYNKRSEWIARYDASDGAGNAAEQVVFAIILNDPIAPVWFTTPKGKTIEAGAKGSTFAAPYGVVKDNYDGLITATPSVTSIDTHTCGTKKITYTAADKAGMFGVNGKDNAINPLTISFKVEDTTPPTCSITKNVASTYECAVDSFKYASTKATDIVDGPLKAKHSGAVNTKKVGSYKVTYCQVSDSGCGGAKNTAKTIAKTYKVTDTIKPVISVSNKHQEVDGTVQYHAGEKNQQLKVDYQKKHLSGFTCTDKCATNLKPTTSWAPKPFACKTLKDIGTYTLKYECNDGFNNAVAKTQKVICVDKHIPVLNLVKPVVLSVEANKALRNWPDPGATCVDTFEGDISKTHLKIEDPVKRGTVGTYTVKYSCCDSSKNCATPQTRKVVVYDDHCPTCTYIGATKITREASFPYVDSGVTCSDDHDGATPYTTVGKFNVFKTGTYKITYRSKDLSGNWNDWKGCKKGANNYVRTIVVKDTLKPVISLSYNKKEIHRSTGLDSGSNGQKNPAHTHIFMEETQTSVNGWIMGAVASATAGIALLGFSMKKSEVTSVPV